MPIVQFLLERSHGQLRSATSNLQDALRRAKQQGREANYIAAINKAWIDSQTVCLHVGNVAGYIRQHDEPNLPDPVRKEN